MFFLHYGNLNNSIHFVSIYHQKIFRENHFFIVSETQFILFTLEHKKSKLGWFGINTVKNHWFSEHIFILTFSQLSHIRLII